MVVIVDEGFWSGRAFWWSGWRGSTGFLGIEKGVEEPYEFRGSRICLAWEGKG